MSEGSGMESLLQRIRSADRSSRATGARQLAAMAYLEPARATEASLRAALDLLNDPDRAIRYHLLLATVRLAVRPRLAWRGAQ